MARGVPDGGVIFISDFGAVLTIVAAIGFVGDRISVGDPVEVGVTGVEGVVMPS